MWCDRQYQIEQRKLLIGQYLVDNPKLSIRKLSEEMLVSKSQIHRDLHDLKWINLELYDQCHTILRKKRKR